MTTQKLSLRFPKRFLWGASTSAHQVEGNTHNNWSVWELENARALAKQAEYKQSDLPIWDEIKDEATNPDNYVSGQAVDHYNRYEEDLDIAKSLNLNAFRFSFEWSRIEPQEGVWDLEAVEHYRQYLKAMKVRGLEPMATLYHWTVPVWFSDKGGFESASNIKYFVRFAEKILMEYGTELRYITTVNEPDTVMSHGYLNLDHPPQQRSVLKAVMVYRNLLKAHKQVFKLARKTSRRFKVGFTKSYAYALAADDTWQSRLSLKLDYFLRDDLILWYVGNQTDFLGVNFYFTDRHEGFKLHNAHDTVNDLGWDMQPANIQFVLERIARRNSKPIIITENGVADKNDSHRIMWLSQTLSAVYAAMQNGAKVEGYLHWSLLDNFEWAFGRWPRFGLVEVDYNTMKRTPRQSAKWYAKAVKHFRGI